VQELRTDSIVETDAPRNFLHVGIRFLAQIRDFVDECDLWREARKAMAAYLMNSAVLRLV
jgi:hypothetical protein